MNPTDEPTRRRRRARAPKPDPLNPSPQYDLDQEARIRRALGEAPEVPEVIEIPAGPEELDPDVPFEDRVAFIAALKWWLSGGVIEKAALPL